MAVNQRDDWLDDDVSAGLYGGNMAAFANRRLNNLGATRQLQKLRCHNSAAPVSGSVAGSHIRSEPHYPEFPSAGAVLERPVSVSPDWQIVAATENERTGVTHLLLESGSVISIKPARHCVAGYAAVVGDVDARILPVETALRSLGSGMILMNADDMSDLLNRLDVGRFFPRGSSNYV
jgi:hypothetical protein